MLNTFDRSVRPAPVNTRNIVLSNLIKILEEGMPSHICLFDCLAGFRDLSRKDRAFIKQLTLGTVERLFTIDHIIDKYSNIKTKSQKSVIRNIVRMGVFQIIFLNVPDSAACNEAVKLAKKRGFTGLSGFVNGILRTVAREKEAVVSDINSPGQDISVRFSVPRWIADYYTDYYGGTVTEAVLEYQNGKSSVQIRCNTCRIDPDDLFELLKKELDEDDQGPDPFSDMAKIPVIKREDDPKCMILKGCDRIDGSGSFKKGLFAVQDYSSVLSGDCFDMVLFAEGKNRTLKILDICASPGGKAMNIADRFARAGMKADITACDVSENKLRLIRENTERCGFDNIRAELRDARVFLPRYEDYYDLVIADVPCSGLGVIGRKPDIRYNMTPERIDGLVRLQREILANAVRYVRHNGYMIFSTCTAGRAENEDNKDFIIRSGFTSLLERRIFPGELDSDGFYYSLLKRSR